MRTYYEIPFAGVDLFANPLFALKDNLDEIGKKCLDVDTGILAMVNAGVALTAPSHRGRRWPVAVKFGRLCLRKWLLEYRN